MSEGRLDPDDATLTGLRLSSEELQSFLGDRTPEQARAYLEPVAAWMRSVNTQNHDGVTLTPALVEFLAAGQDGADCIARLEALREATRAGRFDAEDELQRELEFHRYAAEARRQRDWPDEPQAQRDAFTALPVLPLPATATGCALSKEDRLEVRRAAYEAHTLLQFLRSFRTGTSRPMVVVGNDRYGRIYVVEPLEPYLEAAFTVHYERVPSHGSMRLTVPYYVERFWRNGFSREFVQRLSAQAPHVVLVDVCSPRGTESYTKIPRGVRDLVNWFMVFNHIRAAGDRSRYSTGSGLPEDLLDELQKWHEFEIVRRQIEPWVGGEGETYSISHWAPELKDEVLMGDLVVPARPAAPTETPQVIVANPALYRTEGDDLPDFLRHTHPYHFNDPEKRVAAQIVGGFGDHGFETRVEGTTTDEYVEAVQQQIAAELAAMEADDSSA
jgi:hypothetical protein